MKKTSKEYAEELADNQSWMSEHEQRIFTQGYLACAEETNVEELAEALGDFYGLITEGLIKVYCDEEINIQKYFTSIEQALKKYQS